MRLHKIILSIVCLAIPIGIFATKPEKLYPQLPQTTKPETVTSAQVYGEIISVKETMQTLFQKWLLPLAKAPTLYNEIVNDKPKRLIEILAKLQDKKFDQVARTSFQTEVTIIFQQLIEVQPDKNKYIVQDPTLKKINDLENQISNLANDYMFKTHTFDEHQQLIKQMDALSAQLKKLKKPSQELELKIWEQIHPDMGEIDFARVIIQRAEVKDIFRAYKSNLLPIMENAIDAFFKNKKSLEDQGLPLSDLRPKATTFFSSYLLAFLKDKKIGSQLETFFGKRFKENPQSFLNDLSVAMFNKVTLIDDKVAKLRKQIETLREHFTELFQGPPPPYTPSTAQPIEPTPSAPPMEEAGEPQVSLSLAEIFQILRKGSEADPANEVKPCIATLDKMTKDIIDSTKDPNPGTHGERMLHAAAHGGISRCLNHLLDKKQASLTVHDDEGNTPIHVAAANSLPVLKKFWATKTTAQDSLFKYDKNTAGDTPLHTATKAREIECVTFIILEIFGGPGGINIAQMRNQKGNTPFHEAVISNSYDLVELYLDLFLAAPNTRQFIPSKNNGGDTGLHIAVRNRLEPIARVIASKEKMAFKEEKEEEKALRSVNQVNNTRQANPLAVAFYRFTEADSPDIKAVYGKLIDMLAPYSEWIRTTDKARLNDVAKYIKPETKQLLQSWTGSKIRIVPSIVVRRKVVRRAVKAVPKAPTVSVKVIVAPAIDEEEEDEEEDEGDDDDDEGEEGEDDEEEEEEGDVPPAAPSAPQEEWGPEGPGATSTTK